MRLLTACVVSARLTHALVAPRGLAAPDSHRLTARNDARADVRDAPPPGLRGAREVARSVAAPGLGAVAKDAPGLEAVVAHEEDDGKLGLAEMGGTLFKSCAGGVMLTYAAASGENGLLASSSLIVFFTFLGAFTLLALLDAHGRHGADTLREVLEASLPGPKGQALGRAADVLLATYAICCCSLYIPVFLDLLLPLLERLPGELAFLDLLRDRDVLQFAVCGLIFLPLSFLESLKSMQLTTNLGNFAVFGVVALHVVRACDASYAPGGEFYALAAAAPVAGGWEAADRPALTNLALRVSMAMSAHYNSGAFVSELRDPTPARRRLMVGGAYASLAALYLVLFVLGTRLFGGGAAAPVLNSFASDDGLAQICRWLYLANCVSIYPLVFRPAAISLRALLPFDVSYRACAAGLALVVFAVGCSLDDVGRLSSVCGVLAQTFVWLFPAAITFALAPSPAVAAVWTALLALGVGLIGISPYAL